MSCSPGSCASMVGQRHLLQQGLGRDRGRTRGPFRSRRQQRPPTSHPGSAGFAPARDQSRDLRGKHALTAPIGSGPYVVGKVEPGKKSDPGAQLRLAGRSCRSSGVLEFRRDPVRYYRRSFYRQLKKVVRSPRPIRADEGSLAFRQRAASASSRRTPGQQPAQAGSFAIFNAPLVHRQPSGCARRSHLDRLRMDQSQSR